MGVLLIESLDTLQHGNIDALQKEGAPGDFIVLHPTCAAALARQVMETILAGDLAPFEAMSMGGGKQYEPTKIAEAIRKTANDIVGQWKTNSQLVERGAAYAYDVDIYSDRGRRPKMEDRHTAILDFNTFMGLEGVPPQAYFAVYDGHGGIEAAYFAQTQLHVAIAQHPEFKTNPVTALKEAFLATDKAFLEKAEREALNSGATACTVLVRGTKLYVSWLGDSQAMMYRGGHAQDLMTPHKPERPDEKKRIEDSGGLVIWYGTWRVNGVLSVARAIGDKKLKQWVIGLPDVCEFDLDGTEDYMIIGCDGLWDVMDNDKVTAFIREWREKNVGIQGVAKSMVEHCIDNLQGLDNISIVIVFFQNGAVAAASGHGAAIPTTA